MVNLASSGLRGCRVKTKEFTSAEKDNTFGYHIPIFDPIMFVTDSFFPLEVLSIEKKSTNCLTFATVPFKILSRKLGKRLLSYNTVNHLSRRIRKFYFNKFPWAVINNHFVCFFYHVPFGCRRNHDWQQCKTQSLVGFWTSELASYYVARGPTVSPHCFLFEMGHCIICLFVSFLLVVVVFMGDGRVKRKCLVEFQRSRVNERRCKTDKFLFISSFQ